MKYALFVLLIACLHFTAFAQNTPTETESDSLFKVFLMQSKGVKFNQPYTKDSVIPLASQPDTAKKQTAKQAQTLKTTSAKADSVKTTKPAATSQTVTKAEQKTNSTNTANTVQNKKPNPSPSDTLSKVKPAAPVTHAVPQEVLTQTTETPKVTKIAGLHKFKDTGSSYALEAERKGTVVKLYLRMEDIEQYAEVILVRGTAEVGNFTDVRHIEIIKGANKYEYVETEDRYPLSTKVATAYKVRAVTKDGAIRTFPAITLEPGMK